MDRNLSKAIDFFYKRDYQEALFYFSLVLKDNPDSIDARLGAILSDFASEKEEEAEALFEYYLVSKDEDAKNLEETIEEIIDIIDNSVETLEDFLGKASLENFIDGDNSIKYEDFMDLVEIRGSFKEAFEDIMFSTKVLISKKDDFVDFLNRLIDNGFTDISMNYIESAIMVFPNDKKLISLINKVKNIENSSR